MASTSDANSQSEKNSSLIEQFCSVTGATEAKATKMLEVCSWNLEMAINMHVDSDYPDEDSNSTSRDNSNDVVVDDKVRPPIPPSREILVEESFSVHYGLRGIKRRPRSIFDGLRDFEAEAKWQEMELGARSSSSEVQKKRKTLEDLFRPPLDLMHRGSFESARESGQCSNKWLMVNIQDSQEFACQILNRDVWSNQVVKGIIAKHFVFWQVHCDSAEGQRYIQFYSPVTFPYVAIIDPRTGENLIVWNKIDSVTFCDSISAFINERAVPDGSMRATKSNNSTSLLDVSEEQQMKAAMEASLKDIVTVDEDDEDGSDIETFDSDSESQHAKVFHNKNNLESKENDAEAKGDSKDEKKPDWQDFMGAKDDETTDLVLRLPDGKRERITWPCTSKLRALLLYAETIGYEQAKYELVTNFPRKNLGEMPLDKTLKDTGLYPREMIFIQLKHSSP